MTAANAHADYHANPALGGSTVAKIATGCIRDALVPVTTTDAMRIGSCVDAIWIEGHEPGDVYALPPDVNARTKEGKAQIAAWRETTGGLYTFDRTPDACAERITRTVDALRSHKRAMRILEASAAQVPIFWEERNDHGAFACKGLIDLLPTVDGVSDLVDLKTTAKPIDPRSVRNAILSRGYDYQLAHYRRGLAANGTHVDQVMLIVAQTVEPFGVEVYEISADDIDYADRMLDAVHYSRYAAWKAGTSAYTGHGDAVDGLEPCHTLEINRRN